MGRVGGGVGVDLEEEEETVVVSVLIFCCVFDDVDDVEVVVSSFLLLFDVWLLLLEEESGFCELFCNDEVLLFPAFASASAAFNLTHVSPRAFAK